MDLNTRITNSATEAGIVTEVNRGNKVLKNAVIKENTAGRVGSVGQVELLRFPDNVTTAYPTWVRYEIWDFIPMGNSGGESQSGISHFGVNVAKSSSKSIALGSNAQVEITENQSWKQEAAGGIIDQLTEQLKAVPLNSGTEGLHGFDADSITGGVKDFLTKQISSGGLTGETITDKMALKYDGPDGSRTFSMNHKFVPRSKKESNTAKDILKLFRKYSSPSESNSKIGGVAEPFFTSYKFPSLFKVSQMAGTEINPNYPKYDLCYCKSVNVKYGDDTGNTFHGDNSPVSFEITLSFEEIAKTTQETIIKGF
jgi:hypothetical protein